MDFVILLIKDRYIESGDNRNHQLLFFFKDFIKVIVGIIGCLFVLKYTFNYDIKGLVTGLSIVGAAVALALKESLENLIASFIIFFDKPFETGDLVKGSNFNGVVEKIGLRSTRVRTDAKTYVTVPNKQMVDSVLDNQSNRTQFRGDLKIEIDLNTQPAKINDLLIGIRNILTKPEIQTFNLHFNEIAASSLIISSDYYTSGNKSAGLFADVREKVNLEVIKLIEELNIDLAQKSTNISIVKQQD